MKKYRKDVPVYSKIDGSTCILFTICFQGKENLQRGISYKIINVIAIGSYSAFRGLEACPVKGFQL